MIWIQLMSNNIRVRNEIKYLKSARATLFSSASMPKCKLFDVKTLKSFSTHLIHHIFVCMWKKDEINDESFLNVSIREVSNDNILFHLCFKGKEVRNHDLHFMNDKNKTSNTSLKSAFKINLTLFYNKIQ